LPKGISDKIAAGEVVTSPLSVVKELVENSLDAGASLITVEIESGGKTCIRVVDNGSGIPASEVALAFAPHATSKIKDEADLDSISTLGFRGEALASIAAVSRLEMVTKTVDEKIATRVIIEGGQTVGSEPAGAPNGTSVTVRDIFYNTPARLKFMKSDRSETTKIADLISRIASAYPDRKIRFSTNGTLLFSTPGGGDRLQTILTVFGSAADGDLVEVHAEQGAPAMSLAAWVSDPNSSTRTRRGQVFFVNGRYVKDDIISGAVAEAYREFMFEGRFPHAYIFLEIDPTLLDVNVHPTKSEIKFADGETVRVFVREAILLKLMSVSGIPKAHTARQFAAAKRATREYYSYKTEPAVESGGAGSPRAVSHGASGAGRGGASYESLKNGEDGNDPHEAASEVKDGHVRAVKISDLWGGERSRAPYMPAVADEKVGAESVSESVATVREPESSGDAYPAQQEFRIDTLHVLGDIFGSYIVAFDDDCLYLVDWHAAHERVNYERFMKEYRTGEKLSQELLAPQVLRMPAAAKLRAEEWAAWLTDAGFTAEIFGDGSLIIKAAPAFLGLGEAMRYAADLMEEGGKTPPDNDRAVARLISRACRSSVKANSAIQKDEATALLRSLSACANPYTCPHGRPVFIRYTRRELEKLFKRV
jgi:DNA mismatch repair protein MutL